VAHPFWREPRAPVLLYLTFALTFKGGAICGAPTTWTAQRLLRLLQQGPVLGDGGAAGAARSSAKCNKVPRLRKQASNMLAVDLGGLNVCEREFLAQ
jgi:hypothetical protein